jgi:hypothetical protein
MQVWSNANWELFHYPQTADRRRLTALARDRNAAQKHVWRAEIVLLSADGVGTNEIMRRTGRQLGEERHPSTNLRLIVGEHRWGGRSVIRALSDFRWDPPCIEKVEYFGFVLPALQV